jgi:hypothetical protein
MVKLCRYHKDLRGIHKKVLEVYTALCLKLYILSYYKPVSFIVSKGKPTTVFNT